MKHPIEKFNQAQADLLAKLPEDQRSEQARLLRIGNAAYCYYQEAGQQDLPLTRSDFNDWLDGLPSGIRDDMEKRGFEACQNMLPFKRHVLERRDFGMGEWMKNHLSQDDYKFWQQQS
ncbi:MAG: hypothetical protein AAF693_12945 [Bacteroidota bacterium]